MPIFRYTALARGGGKQKGTVDADSVADARRRLRAANVHVLEVHEEAEGGRDAQAPESPALRLRRVGLRDVAMATRQLATLVRAGMPLVPALTALAEQLADEPLGQVVARVRDRVNAGSTLAAALQDHPKVFPELYVNMVRAGEVAGALEPVLLRLAEMTEKRIHIRTRVRSALAYPLFLMLLSAGVLAFMLTIVIPSISKLFLEMNRALPWPTIVLIKASRLISAYALHTVVGVVVLYVLLRVWIRMPAGRAAWDRLKLRLPLFGDLIMKSVVAHFARTLGVLISSGVTILDALDIVKRVVGNTAISSALEEVKDSVRHGGSIAGSLRKKAVFPPIVLHMIAAGEASGTVADGLLHVADAYDSEVEARVSALTSLLEPVLILVMGAIVGFIVVAILLPIFDINQAVL